MPQKFEAGGVFKRASVTEPGAVEEADKEDMGLEVARLKHFHSGETLEMVPSSNRFQTFH